jgi:hypothetical protein
MAKHRKIEPKKISMLATTGGLFATVLLAAGLFGASQIISSDKPEQSTPQPTEQIAIPAVATITGAVEPSPENGSMPAPKTNPTQSAPRGSTNSPRPVGPPGTGTPAPTVPPVVIPPVNADVEVPGLLSIEAKADLQKGLDVDLDARVGSLLSTEVDIEPTTLPTIVIDLPLLGE